MAPVETESETMDLSSKTSLPQKRAARNKQWRKPKDKPPRNLSAYNYFFKIKRRHILDALRGAEESKNNDLREERGGGFAGLARSVARAWRGWDESNVTLKEACKEMAKIDKERYSVELEEWKNKQQEAQVGPFEAHGVDTVPDQDSNDVEERSTACDIPTLMKIACDEEMSFPESCEPDSDTEEDEYNCEQFLAMASSTSVSTPFHQAVFSETPQKDEPTPSNQDTNVAKSSPFEVKTRSALTTFESQSEKDFGEFEPLPLNGATLALVFDNPANQYELGIILSLAKGYHEISITKSQQQ